MSLSAFNNKVIEFEKSVKRSKVRVIRKLTRQIEHERKKNPNDERTSRKIKRIIEEIHQIRKLPTKDVVLFAMENPGTIAEVLQKSKPNSEDLKQHALIRIATEKSLQSELISFKNDQDFASSWQQLLIMYQSRHEKRLVWKEKSKDFEKIEEALVEQEKELKQIEEKLPKPMKIKTKKTKEKPKVKRSKEAVVYVLDLKNKTAEPLANQEEEQEEEEEKKVEEESKPMESETNSTSASTTVINDPFFLNSEHQITYQKRTTKDKNEPELDDRSFIEHSYFIDALSSSSNRRDGKGDLARQKWAHLTPPTRSRTTNKQPPTNRIVNGMTNNRQDKVEETTSTSLHPSWEASKQAKHQFSIQKSQAKKIVFNNNSDDEHA